MDACSHGCCFCFHYVVAVRSLLLLPLLLPLPASSALDCASQKCGEYQNNSANHTACVASIPILKDAIDCNQNAFFFNSVSGRYKVVNFDFPDHVLVLQRPILSPMSSNSSCYDRTLGNLVVINVTSPFYVSGSSSPVLPSGKKIEVCASKANGSGCSSSSACSLHYHLCLAEILGSATNPELCCELQNDGSRGGSQLASCTVYSATWISPSSTKFYISWTLRSLAEAGTTSSPNTTALNTTAAGPHVAKTCRRKCKHKSSKIVVIGIAVGVVTCATLSFVAVICLCRQKKQNLKASKAKKGPTQNTDISQFFSDSKRSPSGTMLFSYKELKLATASFAESRLLGDGGFSTVYEGRLTDGRVVAVKKLNKCNKQVVQQFHNEVNILSQVRHNNLVQLLGCCSEGTELMLVYEYVPNGTLADHIHGFKNRHLSWENRLMIATETAQALAYLHCFLDPPILHRDVKSTNILLDENFKVKVADFGLSRLMPTDTNHISTAPQGTPGYLDPDYYESYELTEKSDVYSFGVVLMELISAKKAVDMSRGRKDINLASMAISRIQCGALEELVDPELEIESRPEVREEVSRVAELAFRCLASQKDDRPTMREVAHELQSISANRSFSKYSVVHDLSQSKEANSENTDIDKHVHSVSNTHNEIFDASSQNADTEIR